MLTSPGRDNVVCLPWMIGVNGSKAVSQTAASVRGWALASPELWVPEMRRVKAFGAEAER